MKNNELVNKPYHWEYHPVTSERIALIGPNGKDALLATDDGEGGCYLRFQSNELAMRLLFLLNQEDQPTAPASAPDAPKEAGAFSSEQEAREWDKAAAKPAAPDEIPCEGCGSPSTHRDSEGIPLCKSCWGELPDAPQEGTPTPDPYAYEYATTPKEKELYRAIASGFASKGMLYDDDMKEAIFGMVRPTLIMWERALTAANSARDQALAKVESLTLDMQGHTCHENCQRPICVAIRERDAAIKERDSLREQLEGRK